MESGDRGDKRLYPDYMSEILIVIFFSLGLVVLLSLLFPPPLGREISFFSAYQPAPEWYFLWLYQLVRYFSGQWAFIGNIIVPLSSLALLLSIPFIDHGTKVSRNMAIAAFALLFGSFLVLTLFPLIRI